MEVVVDNTKPVQGLILPTEMVATLQNVLQPYLKEGVDVQEVTNRVEVELVKAGSRKATEFIMKKFF